MMTVIISVAAITAASLTIGDVPEYYILVNDQTTFVVFAIAAVQFAVALVNTGWSFKQYMATSSSTSMVARLRRTDPRDYSTRGSRVFAALFLGLAISMYGFIAALAMTDTLTTQRLFASLARAPRDNPMITVDPSSPIPVYEQLITGILSDIDHGDLQRGDRLPPVRRLAGDLGIAPGTVARTYQYLEERGVLSTHGRRGTYVDGRLGPRETSARQAAEAYLRTMIDELGFSRKEALHHVNRTADQRDRLTSENESGE